MHRVACQSASAPMPLQPPRESGRGPVSAQLIPLADGTITYIALNHCRSGHPSPPPPSLATRPRPSATLGLLNPHAGQTLGARTKLAAARKIPSRAWLWGLRLFRARTWVARATSREMTRPRDKKTNQSASYCRRVCFWAGLWNVEHDGDRGQPGSSMGAGGGKEMLVRWLELTTVERGSERVAI